MQQPHFPDTKFAHQTHLRTRWADEDNQKILNNAVYLTLMEEARHSFFSARGQLLDNSFPFVLAQSNVRFVNPGRGGAEVLVETYTSHVGNSSFVQNYRISHVENKQVWCEAEALLVCVDEAGQSRPMTQEFRAALQHELPEPGPSVG